MLTVNAVIAPWIMVRGNVYMSKSSTAFIYDTGVTVGRQERWRAYRVQDYENSDRVFAS